MAKDALRHLSRRERQIMDIVYAQGRVTVSSVREAMTDPPSYSTVRTLMGILEEKGHLTHKQEGLRYVYRARRQRRAAGGAALRNVLRTFYDGSISKAVAALLDSDDLAADDQTLAELRDLVDKARSKDRA